MKTVYDFRLGQPEPDQLKMVGELAHENVRFGPKGMEISFPAGQRVSPTGIELATVPEADFELSVAYQIVDARRPKGGYGTGVNISFHLDSHPERKITFGRFIRPKEGTVFRLATGTIRDGATRNVKTYFFRSEEPMGTLRIRRSGSRLMVLAADGPRGDFKLLKELKVGDSKLRPIRITGDTGGSTAGGQVAISSVVLRWHPATSPRSLFGHWLSWVLVLIVGGCAVGGLFVWRKRASRE